MRREKEKKTKSVTSNNNELCNTVNVSNMQKEKKTETYIFGSWWYSTGYNRHLMLLIITIYFSLLLFHFSLNLIKKRNGKRQKKVSKK